MEKIKVQVPATVANLVCGYDVLGMAIDSPFDEMEVTLTDNHGIQLSHEDSYGLSTNPSENVAGVALLALAKAYGKGVGFNVKINKHIKPGSGLGSSAASSTGAVLAANRLLEDYFTRSQLVEFAMLGEELASGVKHADNIAPCLYGSVTLVRSTSPLDIISIPAPPLYVTVIHPQIEVKTSDARRILKKEVLLKDAIRQWGNIAGLVAGLMKSDYALIGRSLEDHIVEPVRSILIPGFYEAKRLSMEAGALGGGISGSGPSIFMLSETMDRAANIEKVLISFYKNLEIEFRSYTSAINNGGIKILP